MIDGTNRLVSFVTCDPTAELFPAGAPMPFQVRRMVIADPQNATASAVAGTVAGAAPLAVCVGADVPESVALELSRIFDETRPEIGVILLRQPTPELWMAAARAGVRDIVALHSSPSDLRASIDAAIQRGERVLTTRNSVAVEDRRDGRVIVVLSPKGGSGKTMVASNLAIALAGTNTGETVLVDLDCVFGDVASMLGLVPDHTAGQLAALPSFDSTTLKVFLTRHDPSGVYVLAGSGSPEEGEALTDKLAAQILEMLSKDFAYVVVDTAAGLDERALAAVDHATDCVLLASLDVASIRNLVKEIDALDRMGLTAARRHFILNRADTRVGLEVADVESAVGMTVDAALPSSRLVPLNMNRGRPLVLEEPESAVSQQLLLFANRFVPAADGAVQHDRKNRFSLRRR